VGPVRGSSRPRVVAVGIGPAGPQLTTPAAIEALRSAPVAYLRTARHPAAGPLADLRSFDGMYEAAPTFEALYGEIAAVLVDAAGEHGEVGYAVPGSPAVLERTVELLRGDPRVEVSLVAGMSFCELAWAALGVDPVDEGVRLVHAESFARQAAGDAGPLLVAQCWSRTILSDVKLAPEEAPAGAVLLHHLGLADEVVVEVTWSEIDRALEPDHLTSLYVPSVGAPLAGELVRLAELVRTLRERCPWDREQTHHSLVRHLLEEAYEAIEAIDVLADPPSPEQASHLEEELGDLLCQVFFHATLAAEEGVFTLADVARGVHDKLVARHPHVFGDVRADGAEAVVASWERNKLGEKGRTSLMEGIPDAMPALATAAKIERKAGGAGLGFAVTGDGSVLAALLAELLVAGAAGAAGGAGAAGASGAAGPRGARRTGGLPGGKDNRAAEQLGAAAGDLLVGIARLAAELGTDPEAAARGANRRFRERFVRAEQAAAATGQPLHELPLAERTAVWTGSEKAD
jgi:tetrapyrrole methylase family protein/MazG family protein